MSRLCLCLIIEAFDEQIGVAGSDPSLSLQTSFDACSGQSAFFWRLLDRRSPLLLTAPGNEGIHFSIRVIRDRIGHTELASQGLVLFSLQSSTQIASFILLCLPKVSSIGKSVQRLIKEGCWRTVNAVVSFYLHQRHGLDFGLLMKERKGSTTWRRVEDFTGHGAFIVSLASYLVVKHGSHSL